jgi:hypothetical protein
MVILNLLNEMIMMMIPRYPEELLLMNKGLRKNTGKVRMDLLPWDSLMALAGHYTVNIGKYPARNWEKGLYWNEECMASLLRHVGKWSQGETLDEEGRHHDLAIAWNALALVTYRLRNTGEDDRPKKLKRGLMKNTYKIKKSKKKKKK